MLSTKQSINRISTPMSQKNKLVFRVYQMEEVWFYTIVRVAVCWKKNKKKVPTTTTSCLTYRGRCWDELVHPQYKMESYHIWRSEPAGHSLELSNKVCTVIYYNILLFSPVLQKMLYNNMIYKFLFYSLQVNHILMVSLVILDSE